MIIHALQTVLHLHNKYLSHDKYHVHVFRTGYCTDITQGKSRLNHAKQTHFSGMQKYCQYKRIYYLKNLFYLIWYDKKHLKN